MIIDEVRARAKWFDDKKFFENAMTPLGRLSSGELFFLTTTFDHIASYPQADNPDGIILGVDQAIMVGRSMFAQPAYDAFVSLWQEIMVNGKQFSASALLCALIALGEERGGLDIL